MSANLANFYADLLRKYGENHTITYGAPPSYLLTIAGPQEAEAGKKIVFFYKEDRSMASLVKTTPKKPIERNSDVNLDLTGSPLRDDCLADAIGDLSLNLQLEAINPWKPEEEYHRGLSVDMARKIICLESYPREKCSGSVWFLCDGSDFGHTQLIQYEFDKTHFCRGILTYQGVLPISFVTAQSLARQHSMVGGKPMDTCIENNYQVNPNITLNCIWLTHSSVPELINLRDCDVSLKQIFRVSNCSPITQDLMNQLRILAYIREDIVNYHSNVKSGQSGDPTYRCGRGIDMGELSESINQMMNEVSPFVDSYGNVHNDFDFEEAIQRCKFRNITDLTDKLWELLKSCGSYHDLKLAFSMVFQCAARCNIVNTPTNTNRLAEIIRELVNRRLAIPCLNGAEPLELLFEIGLDKVYKDYEFIYTESKVCSSSLLKDCTGSGVEESNGDDPAQGLGQTRKSLHNGGRGDATAGTAGARKTLLHLNAAVRKEKYDDVPGLKNSRFDEDESLQRLSKLFQIHCTLEHLLMLQMHLNLPNVCVDVCSKLLKKEPKLIESIDDKLSDAIDIDLSAHYVREYLDGKDPHSRRIIMKSDNKFREVKTTFYFNMENICPPELAQCFQCDDKEMIEDRIYHSWLYRKIKSFK
ncbi:uncharacterized protein Dwil_GK22553 [Drosophila willistoni]|uniref:Protein zwilch n=1 Tax=Drosophila willistoni TaxID=7260 RepID=B4NFC2_DROWI|nr:protein zwilch [Drosophila willistoni]EDW82989.2 uncharacterized protein Dwil_GK22553 [Drosophila willistoni]